ncbi:MAG: hypothetical protein RLZZ322_1752 [Verrucomicrobiota bacterium]|jgi:hypothetical protein
MKLRLVTSLAIFFSALALGQESDSARLALMSEERRQLQGKFSSCQAKIYPNPDLATADAQLQMEQINKEILKLSSSLQDFEVGRYRVWANESFWIVRTTSGKTVSYWNSGPSAKFWLQKLDAQLVKLKSMKVPVAGPFKRPDLNTSQQTLDAIRATLELDTELVRMSKQYLNR